MILSDTDILKEIKKGDLAIKPFTKDHVQPASIDLLLGFEFKVFRNSHIPFMSVKEPVDSHMETIRLKKDEPLIIHPREFILGSSIEYVKIPNYLLGRLEGKSSLGRMGLIVHATAGFIDPGFEGQITYEITNLSNLPLAIYGGIKVAQLSVQMLSSPVTTPYGSKKLGSKYLKQKGPTPSRMHLNFRDK